MFDVKGLDSFFFVFSIFLLQDQICSLRPLPSVSMVIVFGDLILFSGNLHSHKVVSNLMEMR